MLTIGKIGKAKAQQQYYEESVAKSREDYYAGSGEAPGEFFGGGSRARGLAGQSSMEHLERLFAGQDPATGEQLRSMKGNVQVHGLDLTFSAPKSVSILYALGDATLQGNIVAGARVGGRAGDRLHGARQRPGGARPQGEQGRPGGGDRGHADARIAPSGLWGSATATA